MTGLGPLWHMVHARKPLIQDLAWRWCAGMNRAVAANMITLTNRLRFLSYAFATSLVAIACGSQADGTPAPGAPASTDGRSTVPPSATPGECRLALADFVCSARSESNNWCCPATFDGACGPVSSRQSTGTCGDTLVLNRNWGTHAIACYYAKADGGSPALTGAAMRDDVDSFCNRTSAFPSGGVVPATCPSGDSVAAAVCGPDAGP